MGALSESFKYGNLSTTYVTKHSEMGDSIFYLHHPPPPSPIEVLGNQRERGVVSEGGTASTPLICQNILQGKVLQQFDLSFLVTGWGD